MRTAWLFLALVACDAGGGLDTANPTPTNVCPTDMHTSTDANVFISGLVFDGVSYYLNLDPTGIYDGRPGACAGDDGNSLDLILLASGAPWAEVTIQVDQAGNFPLTNETNLFRFSITGSGTPVAYENGPDWLTGSLDLTSDPVTMDVQGTTSSKDHNLQLTMSAEGS